MHLNSIMAITSCQQRPWLVINRGLIKFVCQICVAVKSPPNFFRFNFPYSWYDYCMNTIPRASFRSRNLCSSRLMRFD